jgi:hypothetical protein
VTGTPGVSYTITYSGPLAFMAVTKLTAVFTGLTGGAGSGSVVQTVRGSVAVCAGTVCLGGARFARLHESSAPRHS